MKLNMKKIRWGYGSWLNIIQRWDILGFCGRKPAPVDRLIPLLIGFLSSKVVQDFFHPQSVLQVHVFFNVFFSCKLGKDPMAGDLGLPLYPFHSKRHLIFVCASHAQPLTHGMLCEVLRSVLYVSIWLLFASQSIESYRIILQQLVTCSFCLWTGFQNLSGKKTGIWQCISKPVRWGHFPLNSGPGAWPVGVWRVWKTLGDFWETPKVPRKLCYGIYIFFLSAYVDRARSY